MTLELNILVLNIKNSLLTILGIILTFLMPIVPLLLIVGVAIALDTIFGILRARKVKEDITSRKMSKLISKLVLYQSAVILFFCIEKFILSDIIGLFCAIPFILTKIVATTLLCIEGKSINENYKIISGVNMWKSFKNVLNRSKEIKKDIKEIVE